MRFLGAYGGVYNSISKYGDKRKYFLSMFLIKEVGKIWKSTNKTFHYKIDKNSNELLIGNLNRHLYVNVIHYKKPRSRRGYY